MNLLGVSDSLCIYNIIIIYNIFIYIYIIGGEIGDKGGMGGEEGRTQRNNCYLAYILSHNKLLRMPL